MGGRPGWGKGSGGDGGAAADAVTTLAAEMLPLFYYAAMQLGHQHQVVQ